MEPVLSGFQLAPGQNCSDTWSKGRENWKDLFVAAFEKYCEGHWACLLDLRI